MARIVLLILLLAAAFVAACSKPAEPPPYAGLWEWERRGPQGQTNSFVVGPDTAAARFFLTSLSFRYEMRGDSMWLHRFDLDSLTRDTLWFDTLTIPVTLSGDTLHRSIAGHDEWLVRVAGPASSSEPVVGTWLSVRSTDSIEYHRYHRYDAGGIFELRKPFSKKAGHYFERGDTVFICVGDNLQDTTRCLLQVTADTLTLHNIAVNGVFPYTYYRADDTAWYDIVPAN